MKIVNKCGNGLSHEFKNEVYYIANGDIAEVPTEVAKVWLKIQGVEEYADPEELKKVKAELEEVKKTAKKTTKKKTK